MDKSRLEELKEKNKIYMKRKQWEQNALLQDCLHSFDDMELLETEQDISSIAHRMCESFPIDEHRHIEGAYELLREEIDFVTSQKYYILWDDAALPVIKCSGKSILQCLDDIFAVSFDTYIFSENFSEIIHSDESGILWRYF